jgi:hypothetical protein
VTICLVFSEDAALFFEICPLSSRSTDLSSIFVKISLLVNIEQIYISSEGLLVISKKGHQRKCDEICQNIREYLKSSDSPKKNSGQPIFRFLIYILRINLKKKIISDFFFILTKFK